MRTLLTGFGPFRNVVDNPSARIVAHYADTGISGHDLTTHVLPVSFLEGARQIRALLEGGGFDLAVLMGVAGRESAIRLERWGRDSSHTPAAAQERGMQSAECRVQDAECGTRNMGAASGERSAYRTHVPIEALAEELTATGFPARISDDAGSYVCDHTYHAALATITEGGLATRCLFIHVPADDATFDAPSDSATMPLDRQIAAIACVFDWLSKI